MSKICMGCMSHYEDGYNLCPHCGYIEDSKAEDALHMEPGSILRERYIIGKVLGFGGFGVTYIGWDAMLEQKVAVKEYLPSEFSTRVPGQTQITVFNGDKAEQFKDGLIKFVEEAQRLAKFHQEEGVVRIFDSFESNNTAYIVMEYLQGETLADYLKREKTMSPNKAIALLMPVIRSLESVNERGIIHRDIAPDNIFLTDDGRVKLIDFGAARFATTSHSRSLTVIIKPGYSPEEQYRSRGDQGSHTDVYAIGATLYRMITGEVPPDAFERRAYFESKKKDILKPISKFAKNITENQETAILNAINVRIEDRTQDMTTLTKELMTKAPDKVKRLHGKIKRNPLYRWPLWAKIAVPVAMLTVLTLSVLLFLGVIGFDAQLQTAIDIPDGMSRVPSIVNNDMMQAEERLNSVTLLYSIVGRNYSDQVPANLVLSQNINAGSVVIVNTIIEITISGGNATEIEPNVMPDLRFRAIYEVVQILDELGLHANIEYDTSETVSSGLVISQYPVTGAATVYGDIVTLVVSTGAPIFAMPNVVGMTEANARNTLNEKLLAVTVEYEVSDTVAEGNVIRQSIDPNAQVNRGYSVVIIIASRSELIQVANVEGMTRTDAVNTLRAQGLEVTVNEASSATVPVGTVVSQQPAADSSQIRGTHVIVTVSTGISSADVSTPTQQPAQVPTHTSVPTNILADGSLAVSTPQQLRNALSGSNPVITLTQDIEGIPFYFSMEIDRQVTLRGNRTLSYIGLRIRDGGHLILDGPTLRGYHDLVSWWDNGNFTMISGEIIISTGSGTAVGASSLASGSFIMHGGRISSTGVAVAASHGGVSFSMTGGNISGGNIGVWGGNRNFAMSGGTISGNNIGVSLGVEFASSRGDFSMTGGTITGNRIGLQLISNFEGEVNINGGNISGNDTDIDNQSNVSLLSTSVSTSPSESAQAPEPTPEPIQTQEPGRPTGQGTASDPFLVAEAENLQWIHDNLVAPRTGGVRLRRHGTYFRLIADIVAPPNLVIGMSGPQSTVVFLSNFDGNGHTITVDIDIYGSHAGLFAIIGEGSVVQNLTVNGSVRNSKRTGSAGGVASRNDGQIINTISNAIVSGESNSVGEIVGRNFGIIN